MKFTLMTITIIALLGCSKSSDNNSSNQGAEVVVQANDTATNCSWAQKAFDCSIETTDGNEQVAGEMDIAFNKAKASKKRSITIVGYTYVADGAVHKDSNSQGVDVEYSVSCSQDSAQINVKSTNSPWVMKFDLKSINTKNLQVSFFTNTSTGKIMRGSGNCSPK